MTFLKKKKKKAYTYLFHKFVIYCGGLGGCGQVPKHLYIIEFVLDVSFLCYTTPQEFKNVLLKPYVFLKDWD